MRPGRHFPKTERGFSMKEKNTGVLRLVLRVLQGMLIGVGAVLPGISGGVVFGI